MHHGKQTDCSVFKYTVVCGFAGCISLQHFSLFPQSCDAEANFNPLSNVHNPKITPLDALCLLLLNHDLLNAESFFLIQPNVMSWLSSAVHLILLIDPVYCQCNDWFSQHRMLWQHKTSRQSVSSRPKVNSSTQENRCFQSDRNQAGLRGQKLAWTLASLWEQTQTQSALSELLHLKVLLPVCSEGSVWMQTGLGCGMFWYSCSADLNVS